MRRFGGRGCRTDLGTSTEPLRELATAEMLSLCTQGTEQVMKNDSGMKGRSVLLIRWEASLDG